MTKSEYEAYKQRVAKSLEGGEFVSAGVCRGCELCGDEPEDKHEPYFSWLCCELCGDHQGGMRSYVHSVLKGNGKIWHFRACEDCVYYVTYGRLDDRSMDEVNREPDGGEEKAVS